MGNVVSSSSSQKSNNSNNGSSSSYAFDKVQLDLSTRVVNSKVLEKVECSICADTLKEPLQCLEGHSHCSTCFRDWRQKQNTCPTCRSILPEKLSRNRFIEEYIRDVEVHCTYYFKLNVNTQSWDKDPFDGCQFTGTVDECEKHETHHCLHRPTICVKSQSLATCGWIKTKDMDLHLNQKCTYSTIPCKACSSKLFVLYNHLETCHRFNVKCEYCNESMEKCQLDQHLSSICQEKLEQCPLGPKICNQMVARYSF
ncbi:TRAF-type zinc finger-containing protein [Cavenderia fasciculata]|uniref:TRAF-type zinc finger-containing protein n=1 Tax=Cavenderia fasciculata TaxID=261658 RepID=F4Q288_CACFS|nr:TRAF-type zinc finger-containing protein [Cavenderia fasciculata]EGG18108.1 TRAF-type zinc finger-containing protein [Cavenderia fasciculata]|eukprot:XP_004366149.1 TRAF-type zinc finger-containing protein [Cavenderia fasciculata]